jgi:hypothetical protein
MLKSKFKLVMFSLLLMVSSVVLAQGSFMGQAQGQAQSSDSSTNVTYEHNVPRTVPSALAPSVVNGNDCTIMQADTKAFSIFIASFSGTIGTTFNEICYAYKRGQFKVADTLACMRSRYYAKANPECATLDPQPAD